MKKYLNRRRTHKDWFLCLLPGCISTGRTRGEVERNMGEAIAFHLDGLREEGQAGPNPKRIPLTSSFRRSRPPFEVIGLQAAKG